MTIYVDADSCPADIRRILARAGERRQIPVIFVGNRRVGIPGGKKNSQMVVVESLPQAADEYMLSRLKKGDLLITRDIPLAAEALKKEARVLNDRGDTFTEETIGERLSLRNFSLELRLSGLEKAGKNSFNKKDVQNFANTLDRTLTSLQY